MSELIVIGYDDEASATQAYNQVLALNKDFVVKLTGLAIVTVDGPIGQRHIALLADAIRRYASI